MELKRLSFAELEKLYKKQLPLDFPESEIKPWSVVLRLIESSLYSGYGLFDNDKLIAYAFFTGSGEAVLLDHYAVLAEHRGSGVGSDFLSSLAKDCEKSGIIIEVERVSTAADEAEKTIRERRIAFYKRCGCVMTGVEVSCFEQPYSIMYLPIKLPFENVELVEALTEIYRSFTDDFDKEITIEVRSDNNIRQQAAPQY